MPETGCWLYVRCEKTYWCREDGRKEYIGHFRRYLTVEELKVHNATTEATDSVIWEDIAVMFWAKNPILAMRSICKSRTDPQLRSGHCIN